MTLEVDPISAPIGDTRKHKLLQAMKLDKRTERVTNSAAKQTAADFILFIGCYYRHIYSLGGSYRLRGPDTGNEVMIDNRLDYY
jgi:hypothetical protein